MTIEPVARSRRYPRVGCFLIALAVVGHAGAPRAAMLATCGDGAVGDGEDCDDGGKVDGDGCSAACRIEALWICLHEPSVCWRDSDRDGVLDEADNCIDVANPEQADGDENGVGDACDDVFGPVYVGGCSAGGGGGLVLVLGALVGSRRRWRA